MTDTTAMVAKRFPVDVAEHELRVLRVDHIDRHLRFQKPGTYNMGFDLITWRGHLCFTGDMGTFVFARVPDMFTFFRADGGQINPQYWGEKVLAADRHDGITAFNPDMFRAAIRARLDNAEASAEVRAAAQEEVLSAADDGEHEARDAAMRFQHESGFTFADFWESDCHDYTYRFVWCCHALVWGIAKFDALQNVNGKGVVR